MLLDWVEWRVRLKDEYLVKDHHRTPPQHRSGEPDQLSLPLTQIVAASVDLRIERPLMMLLADLTDNAFAFCIGILVERVEILAKRAREE